MRRQACTAPLPDMGQSQLVANQQGCEKLGRAERRTRLRRVWFAAGLRSSPGLTEFQIKTWLDRVLKGYSLPLDQYTWRVLAFGKS